MDETKATVRYMIDDVAAAIAFYPTHLGFTVESEVLPAFAAVTRGPLRLLLSGPASSGRRPMPDGRQTVPGGWNRIQIPVAILRRRRKDFALPGFTSATKSYQASAALRSSSTIHLATP
jgi:hypothetical protein